jgi:hypothetical protein
MEEPDVFQPDGDDDLDGEGAYGEAHPEIEYWLWTGEQLVPASPDQEISLRDIEARRRLTIWQANERRRAHVPMWQRLWNGVTEQLAAVRARLRGRVTAPLAASPTGTAPAPEQTGGRPSHPEEV